MMNIDRIIGVAQSFPPSLRRALLLTLTSASGQMSNMVFAIKNRGSKGTKSTNGTRIEVGSWVIGYWLPKTHFEINVWNCFTNRANKLLKALPGATKSFQIDNEISYNEWAFSSDVLLLNNDCRLALKDFPDKSISFICTDPPHSDRVPYLELSEMWNSILGYHADFENEIVVSNAKEREKSKSIYNENMIEFFLHAIRVLEDDGYIALFFNAKDEESWEYLRCIKKTSQSLRFIGCFPMAYSATSVVQDNRKGAMKSDYVLIYRKNETLESKPFPCEITTIPGWSNKLPSKQ